MNPELLARATLSLFLMAFFVIIFIARGDFDASTTDLAAQGKSYASLF